MRGNNTFAIAYRYHTLGWCVIPSGGGPAGKSPLVSWTEFQKRLPTEAELRQWQSQFNPKLWGIVTGKVSGIFIVDADNAIARDFLEKHGLQPHIETPRGGAHYHFRYPGFHVKTMAGILPGIDVRGDGGFVNLIGERADGQYTIVRPPEDGNLYEVAKLPAEMQRLLRPKSKTPLAERILQEAVARAQPGNRNDTGLWLACQLRDNGVSQSEAEAVMLHYATQVGNTGPELYTEREAIATLEQAYGRPAREASYNGRSKKITFALTDLGNAERLASEFGDRLRYCYERKRWLFWTGKVWEWDWGNKVKALAKLAVRNIYHEAADEPDEKRCKELAHHARSSESGHRIDAMINLAESEPGIPVKVTELDTNPWLFNCLNGTIDLTTGQLLPHRKEDLLTVIVPVEYHPDAPCPRWLTFLNEVTGGDAELQGYLQRAVGYSLTGDTKSQVLFFLYGLGNNGKSTFVTTIRKMHGGYAERANTDLFMLRDKNIGGPKEGLANLKGKRFVVASELEDGRRLAVSLIKDMTGGETIKADRKYEHEIEYQPTHKLWLVGNHKPVITDTTLSIWRRVKLIPFTVTIPDNKIDPVLPSKLEAELPGILAWAVKGCLVWQWDGLKDPEAVTTATAEYRHEQDILSDFIEDCCILERSTSIPKGELKDEYQRWCEDNKIDPVTQRTFKARLIEKGITEGRIGKARYWRGIRLRTDADSGNSSDKSDNTLGDLALEVTRRTEKSGNSLYKENLKEFTENPVTLVTDVTAEEGEELEYAVKVNLDMLGGGQGGNG